jgi:hypothetical protein
VLHALRRGYGFRGVSSVPVSLFFVNIRHHLLTDKAKRSPFWIFVPGFLFVTKKGFSFSQAQFQSFYFQSFIKWKIKTISFKSSPNHVYLTLQKPDNKLFESNYKVNYQSRRVWKDWIEKQNYSDENKTKYQKKREFVVNKKEKHQSKVVYFLNRLPTLHLKILKKLHKKMFNNYQRIF